MEAVTGTQISLELCIRLGNSKLREIVGRVELVGVAWSRYRGFLSRDWFIIVVI